MRQPRMLRKLAEYRRLPRYRADYRIGHLEPDMERTGTDWVHKATGHVTTKWVGIDEEGTTDR